MRLAFVIAGMFWMLGTAQAACNYEIHAPWDSAKDEVLMLNAYSVGGVCGFTAVVLTVTDKDGKTLWTMAREAQHVSIFADEKGMSTKEVQEALQQWLDIGLNSKIVRTKQLPDWPKGADEPTREGEFGYYKDDTMDRSFYMEQRAANRPLFCTVQGIESEVCITVTSAGLVQEFGGFSFPG